MENPDPQRHKCSLFEEEIAAITYNSGGTYTLGALLEVQCLCIFKRLIFFTRRFGWRAVDGKRYLESKASSILGTLT